MPLPSGTIEDAVRAACLLEVTARKVGNVHPLASFADCDWGSFAASADAIAPVLGSAERPIGEMSLRAVEATKSRVAANTNLGMVLLLAPLAAVPPGEDLEPGIARVLSRTTADDCGRVYEAIRVAHPGGLGSADREDVASTPTVTLVEAMRLAADRDSIARQYANGFADVFRFAEGLSAACWPELERQIVAVHLDMIASGLETLIERKCGPALAGEAARRAKAVQTSRAGLNEFDAWLRADGHRRNPGTTADLVAAALFVAVRRGSVPCFSPPEVAAFAEEIRQRNRPGAGQAPLPAR